MTTNWLQTYLVEAVRRSLCTKIYCTTCGAMEFRRGVLVALTEATGLAPRQKMNHEAAIEITRALGAVTPDGTEGQTLEPAVRYLLFDLWSDIFRRGEIEALLSDSWAGGVLRAMEKHNAARVAEHRDREEFQDPVRVQQRREEKKRLKQERHRERLALKEERDRIWREKQGKPD
jgi:hypothetical protein